MKRFTFKFFDGHVFTAIASSEREALRKLGLEAYNYVAYTVMISDL